MEFEVLSEKIEWEARRVAAALGIKEWDEQTKIPHAFFAVGYKPDFSIRCSINDQAHLTDLGFENAEDVTIFRDVRILPEAHCLPCFENPSYNELMARSLYRLGFEDEAVLAGLDHPFTAHERLELRLSMPREFWPQAWLDEAKGE